MNKKNMFNKNVQNKFSWTNLEGTGKNGQQINLFG